jgi:hypothetical protein
VCERERRKKGEGGKTDPPIPAPRSKAKNWTVQSSEAVARYSVLWKPRSFTALRCPIKFRSTALPPVALLPRLQVALTSYRRTPPDALPDASSEPSDEKQSDWWVVGGVERGCDREKEREV